VRLQHHSDVDATPDEVWAFLQDTPAVVRCLPGAELVEVLGDDRYEGMLRVAIGPLKMNYAGQVSVVERNGAERRITLNATGRDKRGSGGVQAHARMEVSPTDTGSRIDVVSDLDLSGRIASLGRGVRDVSNRMFVEFAGQLSARVQNSDAQHQGQALRSPSADGPMPQTGTSQSRSSTGAVRQSPSPGAATTPVGEIKIMSLLWTVTRERIANLLERLSLRVRPR
jgi:carbon monoxide dehydrogenase subunit G